MIKKDIPLYKLDLTGVSKYNKVTREYGERSTSYNNHIIIPNQAPFYISTVSLFSVTGEKLVEGTDYEFYGILGKLTKFTAKPVGLFIKLKNDNIKSWYITYQVVGNFNKITNELINMLESNYQDDRLVNFTDIENRPLYFDPPVHQHDLAYNIFGFTDLAKEIIRIGEIQSTLTHISDVELDALELRLERMIDNYKNIILDLVKSHDSSLHNNHGVTKEGIGLEKVDNYPVATLQEALEGTRTDLHLTPYIAAQAIGKSSGKNNGLFPAGQFPFLRYGSDTFIPPIIQGSFEGIGGYSRRCGAIVESDGTLLILEKRYNGKVDGLYFVRCKNWSSQDAKYEFTGYRYVHPTATADGATLNTIINGSNRYIMVVGDSNKNIWYWTETHGTFNPDRHTLHRLTGEWVNEDVSSPGPTWVENPWDLSTLLVDNNYKNHFGILQGYPFDNFKKKRPNNVEYTKVNPDAKRFEGFSFNIVSNLTGNIKRAKVDFSHPIFGKQNDDYFTPYMYETVDVGDETLIKSYFARFSTPIKVVYQFRALYADWLKANNDNQFSFRFEYSALVGSKDGGSRSWRIPYRALLDITTVNGSVTVRIAPATGDTDLISIDTVKLWDEETSNGKAFAKYKYEVDLFDPIDLVGRVHLGEGQTIFVGGASGTAFPSTYLLGELDFLKNKDVLLKPTATEESTKYMYNDRDKIVYETNPIGFGGQFVCQKFICSDYDNPLSSGIMARMMVDGVSKWVFREVPWLGSDWKTKTPTGTLNLGGTEVINYDLVSKTYQTNLGPKVVVNSYLPVNDINWQEPLRRIFGADRNSTYLGKLTGLNYDERTGPGDGVIMDIVDVKLIDNVVTFKPKIAFNIMPAIKRSVIPLFEQQGISAKDVEDSWYFGRGMRSNGDFFGLFTAFTITDDYQMKMGFVFCHFSSQGPSRTLEDGCIFYDDSYFIQLSEIKTVVYLEKVLSKSKSQIDFGADAYRYSPAMFTVPYGGINNGVMDTNNMVIMTTSSTFFYNTQGSIPSMLLSVSSDFNTLNGFSRPNYSEWGPETDWGVQDLKFCIGGGQNLHSLMEGAGTVTHGPLQTGNIFNNIVNGRFDSEKHLGISNLMSSQYTVYFEKQDSVLLAGKEYSIAATYIDLRVIDPSPANKTFYIYVRYQNSTAEYEIVKQPSVETSMRGLIAVVNCGPTQIESVVPYNRFSLDGASISPNRQGGTILASSGSVFDKGDTSSILKDDDYIS